MFGHTTHAQARVRRGSLFSALLAMVASLLAFGLPAAPANAAGGHLVINEVFGGGGNSGAPYTNDFIELFNPTSTPVTMSNWSVQYASATGSSWQVTAISGTVPANGYFLVQEAAGSTASAALPSPDATGTIAMSGTAGKVLLRSNNTTMTDSTTGNVNTLNLSGVVDFVGFGTTTTSYEGTVGPTPAPSNSLSVSRNVTHDDSDNNNGDFSTGAPSPKNHETTESTGPTPLSLAAISNVKTLAGKSVSIQTQASGGTGTKSYSLTGNPSTGGLAIDQSGLITGTPTDAGVYHLTATVTAGSETASKNFDLTVVATNHANHVVISEFWGDGGYTNAPFTRSYVELYNPTNDDVDLSTWSLGWMNASSSNTPSTTYQSNLTGTIKAGGYYLIGGSADASAFGIDLPSVDDEWTPATNWDYRDGSLALINTQSPVALTRTSAGPQDAHVVDLLGYGPTTGFKPVAYETDVTGTATSLTVGTYRTPVDSDTDDNSLDFQTGEALSPTNAAGDTATPELPPAVPTTCASGFNTGTPSSPVSIATIQGTTDVSDGAACDVVTEGVVTAIYSAGYADNGAASCGLCGFYIQTDGSYAGQTDSTPGQSDAIFVSAGTAFRGLYATSAGNATLAVGDKIQVKGKVGEVRDTGKEYRSQIVTATATSGNVTKVGTGSVTAQTALPETYGDREAHEGELFKPTDVVITDNYNFETAGELGLASGGQPLQQPGQVARDGDSAAISAAQKDVKDRGYFLWGGTNYLTTGIYKSATAKNSDIPYPFISAAGVTPEHTARTGASVTYPDGGVLDFRNGKWYLDPPRSVVATCANSTAPHGACTPDYGTGAIDIENTRVDNQQPADPASGSNIRFATYNVENFFSVTMQQFADANPWYQCEYDDDRQGNHVLAYQCNNPTGMATAWDPVTGAATAYSKALATAPRGAARQEDLDRQTAKIVTAINRLGADVVALEEIGNPNKLKLGVTNSPLSPDLNNKKDQGQGTAIEWRDETVAYLVDHLNANLPPGEQWAFVASPEETTDSTSVQGLCSKVQPNGTNVPGPANLRGTCSYASGQDAIRSAFIYKKSDVVPVGQGDLDLPGYTVNGTPDPWGNHVFSPNASPFDNAREPLAQYFKPVGARNNEGFALIVNHFKSKGDADAPAGPATGGDKNSGLHGAFNASRVAQAKELVRFANAFADKWDTDNVFLLGDFNAYSGEDPVHAITDASNAEDPLDFEEIHSDDPNDTSYVFTTKVNGVSYGGAGSLDHIIASAGARGLDPHTDIWEINANEPDLYNYSRYNTNATTYFDGSTPWRGSDHNPEIVDLNLPSASAGRKVTDVQILGINDFHGRLIADASDGGAAPLAGAVKSLRDIYGANETVLASAGDNVGASIFESFTQEDKPALDALNEMNLQVSSVGNHEFDKGVNDLLNRIEKPYDATDNPYGADDPLSWGDYLAANVVWKSTEDGHTAGEPISDPTKMIEVDNPLSAAPIKIGFVGTVTSDLASLQSPGNLEGVTVLDNADTVDAVNDYAAALKADGADLVVLLTHEGAATTDCSTMRTAGTAFSTILNGVDNNVDAILSGHTHLEYSCQFPMTPSSTNALGVRPVLQGASYGTALDQLVYSFDADNKPVDLISNNVGVKGPNGALFNYGPDPDVQPIVDDAIDDSAVAGAQVLGRMTDPMYRSKLTDGSDNRGGESVLGNQIAEIQRWATAGEQQGGAQIAFMNPGGLRADAPGTSNGTDYDLTYREAADVQPFANELVNMKLTGAQIKQVLEEQWQRDASGNIPARPFLKLGISKGFTYTYTEEQDPAKPTGAMLGTVTGMWLDGEPIDLDEVYSVTVNSFLATGGDNFWELNNGQNKLDTEQTDLQAQVNYMKQYDDEPLEVDSSQRSVRVTFPDGAPSTYSSGEVVSFDLASLDLNSPEADKDDTIDVMVGDQVLESDVPVDRGNGLIPDDRWGTASVSFTVPANSAGGQLHVVGEETGTDVLIPATVEDSRAATTVSAPNLTIDAGQSATLEISVDPAAATGNVTVKEGSTTLGSAELTDGETTFVVTDLGAGTHTLSLHYEGDASYAPSDGTTTVTVDKLTPTVDATASPTTVDQFQSSDVQVHVSADNYTPTGTITCSAPGTSDVTVPLDGLGEATCTVGGWDSAGTRTVTVTYNGDDRTATGSGSVDIAVSKAGTSTLANPANTTAGSTVDLPVAVSSTGGGSIPTGTFTCSAPGMTDSVVGLDSDAEGTCVLGPWDTAGQRTVTVTYSGDANYAGSSTTTTVTVGKATSTVGASANPTSVVVDSGTSVVTTTVSSPGADPTGTVTCDDGTPADVNVNAGTATCTVGPWTSTGTKTVTLTYSGDANTTGGSTTVAISVTSGGGGGGGGGTTKVDTSVTGTAAPITWGDPGSVAVTVTSTKDTTGTVTLKDGGTQIGSASVAADGTATIVIAAEALEVGTHTLDLAYSGDDLNNASTGTVQVVVERADSTTALTVTPDSVRVNQDTVTMTATVSGAEGTTGMVQFSVDGVAVATVPVGSDGTATAQAGPFDSAGTHTVTAVFTGDDHVAGSEDSADVTVTKASPKVKVERRPNRVVRKKTVVKLDVTVKVAGQTPGGDVRVIWSPRSNRHHESVTQTLSGGETTVKVGPFLRKGKTTVKIVYLGDDDNESVDKTISFTVHKPKHKHKHHH